MLRRNARKLMAAFTASLLTPFGASAEMAAIVDKPVSMALVHGSFIGGAVVGSGGNNMAD